MKTIPKDKVLLHTTWYLLDTTTVEKKFECLMRLEVSNEHLIFQWVPHIFNIKKSNATHYELIETKLDDNQNTLTIQG